MSKVEWLWHRVTKCDSGAFLNPLMHVFLYITTVFSVSFLLGIDSVTLTVLYQQTANVGAAAVNVWGLVGVATMILHTAGMLVRGRWGLPMLAAAGFGGSYLWLWAATVYITGGFLFQTLAGAAPNLLFWAWYAWQWRKRYNNINRPEVSCFV